MSSDPLGPEAIPPANPSPDRRKLILSVADELNVLYHRYQLLFAGGYAVLSASDGAHALQLFADHPIDLVVMDYALPEMDGGLVAEAMKEYEPSVPIIMVSNGAVPDEALTAVSRCLRQSEDSEPLLDAIRELMKSCIQMRVVRRRSAG